MKNGFRKIISMIVIGLLVLIVVAALLINIFGDVALKTGVETGASKAMKVDVTLNDISLAILAGKLNMNSLVVENPEGYQNPTFLELGHGFVDLKITSLLSDTIEIEKIQLDNVSVTIEQKGLSNNLKEILNNLPKAEPTEEKPAEEKTGKNLLIKQLDIESVKVTVKLLPVPGRADNLTLDLAPIHMENIGSGEKINTPQLVSKILLAIAGAIAEKGKGVLPLDMINSIGDQLSEQGQQLLEAGKDVGTGIIESGKDIGKEATDALKGLNPFQRKEE
ncbi:MAG: AsmA family protein [Phycisphaerae bacterium]|nr:AsmA family protein [Phycisphaerae bacterium]